MTRTVLALAALLPTLLQAQSDYDRRIFFDHSLTPNRYFYSSGKSSKPSALRLDRGRVPVDSGTFLTPPNALRLEWQSSPQGHWEAVLDLNRWRNRDTLFLGDTLSFWCYSAEPLPAALLPRLRLRGGPGVSAPLALDHLAGDLAPGRWVRVAVPLRRFAAASGRPLDPRAILAISFLQGVADGAPHTLVVDEIRVDGPKTKASLSPPTGLRATGSHRHVDLTWRPTEGKGVERYIIHRSLDGVRYQPVGIQRAGVHRYSDFVGRPGITASYKVTVSGRDYRESAFSQPVTAATRSLSDEDLLTMVQEASFRYYWEAAHPSAGMALENVPGDPNMVATGASGFGIMALLVGVERGFITRAAGARRLLTIVDFLARADRFHGVWPHFLDGRSGKVLPVFGKYDNGGDLVETAFLIQGLLAARQYFTRDDEVERRIVRTVTSLWEGVEWDWYRRFADGEFLYWHWSPDHAWHMNHKLIGFNETLIAYVLAIASPSHPVPASLYYGGWASQSDKAALYRRGWGGTNEGDRYLNRNRYYGIRLDVGVGRGGPLFFTHYSYLGLDPRAVRDHYTNHFDNNRAIARINREWVRDNPGDFAGYETGAWGLTASDGPDGYMAHEPRPGLDDGTITPTGALSSFPYTPQASLGALRYFYDRLGPLIWDVYGFRDAYNLSRGWVAPIYMGLNQAPIVVMIENYRSGLIWRLFMANPEIGRALERIRPDRR